jgi:hypothetical protein
MWVSVTMLKRQGSFALQLHWLLTATFWLSLCRYAALEGLIDESHCLSLWTSRAIRQSKLSGWMTRYTGLVCLFSRHAWIRAITLRCGQFPADARARHRRSTDYGPPFRTGRICPPAEALNAFTVICFRCIGPCVSTLISLTAKSLYTIVCYVITNSAINSGFRKRTTEQ